jgi:hypothetical protein
MTATNHSRTNIRSTARTDWKTNQLKKCIMNIRATLKLPISGGIAAIWLFLTSTSIAQCDKNLVLTSSKTEYLNAAGAVQRTVEEDCEIRVSKKEVTISPSGHDKMIGSVISAICEWTEPFKEGKTIVEASFKDDNGAESAATITIEGKGGKVTCTMKEREKPDRIIRVMIHKFEEQKAAAKP